MLDGIAQEISIFSQVWAQINSLWFFYTMAYKTRKTMQNKAKQNTSVLAMCFGPLQAIKYNTRVWGYFSLLCFALFCVAFLVL